MITLLFRIFFDNHLETPSDKNFFVSMRRRAFLLQNFF